MKGDQALKATTMKCPSCGGDLTVDSSGRDFIFCNYCGKQIYLDNGKRTVEINHNIRIDKKVHRQITDDAAIVKAKMSDRENKRIWILLLIALLIPFGMIASMKINGSIARNQGKIQAGFYRDYLGQNYEVVEKQMEAAGFKNIEIIDLEQPGLLGGKKNKVQSISIAGDSSFDSGDWFYPSDKVIISHY